MNASSMPTRRGMITGAVPLVLLLLSVCAMLFFSKADEVMDDTSTRAAGGASASMLHLLNQQ